MKQFTLWLVRDKRANDDRLGHLRAERRKVERVLERRELTTGEIENLLKTTRSGPVRSKLTGIQRYTLYAMALSTGLRAKELASLAKKSLDFESLPVTWTIASQDEKARRGATFSLPQYLVPILKNYIQGVDDEELLWPGNWAKNKGAGKFLKKDLAAARKQWITDGEPQDELQSRNESDFLKHSTPVGNADFHALRHTFLTRLSRSGASPKLIQTLARHSTMSITFDRYLHTDSSELDEAIQRLDPLPGPSQDPAIQDASTAGTSQMVAGLVARSADTDRDSLRSIEQPRPFLRASL